MIKTTLYVRDVGAFFSLMTDTGRENVFPGTAVSHSESQGRSEGVRGWSS